MVSRRSGLRDLASVVDPLSSRLGLLLPLSSLESSVFSSLTFSTDMSSLKFSLSLLPQPYHLVKASLVSSKVDSISLALKSLASLVSSSASVSAMGAPRT